MNDEKSGEEAGRTSIGARRNPETETAVLDAAEALIAEEGYARLTMEAVAKRARAGKATLYRWWPGRAALLLAVYTRSKDVLASPDTGSLEGDLKEYLGTMFAHWRSSTGDILRQVIAEAQSDPAVMAELKKIRGERWHHIRTIFERADRRGELAPGVTQEVAHRRVAAMTWYLLLTDELPKGAAEVAELVRVLLGPIRK